MLLQRGQELLGVGVDPEVEHLEAGPFEHHSHEVLADVVDVALDGADDHRADRRRTGLGQERAQDRHPALHRVGGEEHLGDEQDTVPEVDADDAHAFDERIVQDALRFPPALEQDVRAFLDLFPQAVVEIVVHLPDELVVGQRAQIEFLLFVCTVFAIEMFTLHGGGSSVAFRWIEPRAHCTAFDAAARGAQTNSTRSRVWRDRDTGLPNCDSRPRQLA